MKIRDYFIVAAIVFVMLWSFHPTASPTGAVKDRPFLAGVVKIAKQLGWFMLILGEPPAEPEQYQVIPDAIVNEPPTREPGPDGIVHLDHSAGW